ncbi:bifunctional riboflavin kinase/FAD synthetase [Tolumonas lignilytica]|jgi:riboflavin kinase/FMN adenylyltransferase|uniref:bifunctional riboflavin kinase/FAD synthetase n=1 Tax=Tolumonas lignilytica TaxID=1283284 RepID=UPI0004657285|nr:bifunctional riboflavin kinase/FAD synthetase [Tolumonas lignilytica]
MELIRGIHNIHPEHAGCVLTIGNFDGVHCGHQAVLRRLQEQAKVLGLPSCVMVFEPQPLEFFAPDRAPARLSRLRDKYDAIAALGIDRLLCVKFDQTFAELSATAFIEDILVKKLSVRFLVIGDDFRFGLQRSGDFSLLVEAGKRYGFQVLSTDTLLHEQQRVSSTLLREALKDGRLADVERMLGHPYCITGRVAHGAKLGRTIGFPTANIHLKRLVVPIQGVYAVQIVIADNTYFGVANIGFRPTVNGTRSQLEVHIFDFQDDLYGKQLQIRVCHKLRDEQKFSSFTALQTQITADARYARQWFGLSDTAVAPDGI